MDPYTALDLFAIAAAVGLWLYFGLMQGDD